MLRGFITVKCPYCGKTFKAPDIELGATVNSVPVTCPNCKQRFDPARHAAGLRGILQRLSGKK